MMALDVRIIYIILAIAIAFPLFIPIGLPVASEPAAITLYDKLSSLPSGSAVIFSADLSASGTTELKPMVEVLVDLSLTKGHRVILMALWADGANLINAWTEPIFERHPDLEYGKDYINWGYCPSYSSWLETCRMDIQGALNNRDYLGRPLASFPIMENITKASDIAAVCTFGTGDPGYTHWYQQWRATGDVDIILAGQVAVNTPNALAAFNAGNIQGLAGGLGGAATLEKMHNKPGSAHGNSDAQSFGHLTIIIFLIIGNIGYFGAKNAGEIK